MLHCFHSSYTFLPEVFITKEILNVSKPGPKDQARMALGHLGCGQCSPPAFPSRVNSDRRKGS